MRHYPVIIVGGGATGIGILRDLSMRGIKALLIEQRDLCHGTSSRFHGLLHSGARYAVNDPISAKECIDENYILRKIAKHSVEETEGFFIRTPLDDPEYEDKWLKACEVSGIPTKPITVKEAQQLEPNLASNILSAYRVPDSAIDGFRLVWQNASSALRYGGEVQTHAPIIAIKQENGKVKSIIIKNNITNEDEEIGCDFLVNATGSWVGEVANLAGLKVNVKPDKGVLIAFNHRFSDRIINRLRKSGDGDIFVPHGSITILGTTSIPVDSPSDTRCSSPEVEYLLKIGEELFPHVRDYRMLRVFAGTRPLYSPDGSFGRGATRNFVIIDHEKEGLKGFATITGGKLTTYRLMAEKMTDMVCAKLGVEARCRTAIEPLLQPLSHSLEERAKKIFPLGAIDLMISRNLEYMNDIVEKAEKEPWSKAFLCECEMVTQAEFEAVAKQPTSHSLSDIRRRTRLGMGTCQGSFCGFRAAGDLMGLDTNHNVDTVPLLRRFIEERFGGSRAILWGDQIREMELACGIYKSLLNLDGVENAK